MPVSASFHSHSGGCQRCCWRGLLASRGVGVGDCRRSCWSEVAAHAALPQCSVQGVVSTLICSTTSLQRGLVPQTAGVRCAACNLEHVVRDAGITPRPLNESLLQGIQWHETHENSLFVAACVHRERALGASM
eukprot:2527078-Amphidinium_carterae.1